MKHFIITVDTEGDNLWSWKKGESISTNNAKYIPRFQELCCKYNFKPVYLTNYEMLCDENYVDMVRTWQEQGLCEVGLHLHAWNTPPIHELEDIYGGNPYLIEYPEVVMRAKFKTLYDIFVDKIGSKPYSHRSGRWAMNDKYFEILREFEVKVDCSHTPHISWETSMGAKIGGSDYTNASEMPSLIHGIYEIPLTVRRIRHVLKGSIKHRLLTLIKGDCLQLRPATHNLNQMIKLVNSIGKETDYIQFMIHSSELMPGGSPYFKTNNSIEYEYKLINNIFKYISDKGYFGVTLKEYYTEHNS